VLEMVDGHNLALRDVLDFFFAWKHFRTRV